MTKATVYPLYIENYNKTSNVEVFSFTITVADGNNDPIPNLDGAYSQFNVKTSYSTANTLVSVNTVTNNITINPTTGVLELKLYNADLVNIPRNIEEIEYVYDWDLVDTTGKFYRLLKGSLTFAGDL